MLEVFWVLFVVVVGASVFFFWRWHVGIYTTYRQRRLLIEQMKVDNYYDFYRIDAGLDVVSYEEHVQAVAMFKDPIPLYPANLHPMLKGLWS